MATFVRSLRSHHANKSLNIKPTSVVRRKHTTTTTNNNVTNQIQLSNHSHLNPNKMNHLHPKSATTLNEDSLDQDVEVDMEAEENENEAEVEFEAEIEFDVPSYPDFKAAIFAIDEYVIED